MWVEVICYAAGAAMAAVVGVLWWRVGGLVRATYRLSHITQDHDRQLLRVLEANMKMVEWLKNHDERLRPNPGIRERGNGGRGKLKQEGRRDDSE